MRWMCTHIHSLCTHPCTYPYNNNPNLHSKLNKWKANQETKENKLNLKRHKQRKR